MVTLTIPETLTHHDIIKMTPLDYIEVQRQAAAPVITQLNDAVVSIKTLQDTIAENDRVYAESVRKCEGLLKTNRDQASEIDRLKARIAELEAPPVVTLPPVIVPPAPPVVPVMPLKPIISKTELNFVAGCCITLGFKPPSATVDATARELMKLISNMGFNTVRFFRNKDEVRDDLKRNPEDPRNLYAAAKKLGLTVVADTINRAALDLSDTELSQYLAGLKSLGAALLVFDDANQYNEPKKDGTRYPPNTLKDMVARVRQYSDLPIIASVRANARVEDYKPLFDFVEFQTFGRLTELDDFLRLPADCFVLDGQATIGNDYLRGAHDVIMKYPPNAFFYYSSLDEDTDWRTMTDKVALIEKTVKAWNAARIVKAQPA